MSSLQVLGVRLTVGGSYGVKGWREDRRERGGEGDRQRGNQSVFMPSEKEKKVIKI